jgi:hypothetical protein
MVIEDERDRDLIIVGAGLLAGLLVSVAINLMSPRYPGVQSLTPYGTSIIEPVSIIYLLGIFLGIYLFLSHYCTTSRKFGNIISFIAGFLITIGLSMIGTIL